MSLKESFLFKETKQVAHYTKLTSLKYLFKADKSINEESLEKQNNVKPYLRLNNVSYMNDPTEGIVFLNLLKAESEEVKKLLNDLYENTENSGRQNVLNGKNHVFLLSFSEAIDTSLPMWVQYSDNGEGCCIVFNTSNTSTEDSKTLFDKEERNSIGYLDKQSYKSSNFTEGEIDKESIGNGDTYCLYKVKYLDMGKNEIDEDIKYLLDLIRDALENLQKYINKNENRRLILKRIIINILDQVRFLFKDINYQHEKEVRLVKFESNGKVHFTKDNEGLIVPHIYINLERDLFADEVILGPKVTNAIEIANYLFYTEKVDKVSKSQIKYKEGNKIGIYVFLLKRKLRTSHLDIYAVNKDLEIELNSLYDDRCQKWQRYKNIIFRFIDFKICNYICSIQAYNIL